MTIYAGETVRITVTGTDFDASSPLSDDEVTAVYITIFDATPEVVVDAVTAEYDEDDGAWIYDWNTTGVDPGTYRAKIEAYGVAATPQSYSLEFARIRLSRRPVGG